MTENERLRAWMTENDYTAWTLGDVLGFKSRVAVYRLLRRPTISPNFKLRFIERFGIDVADMIFDPPTVKRSPASPELEPEPA